MIDNGEMTSCFDGDEYGPVNLWPKNSSAHVTLNFSAHIRDVTDRV